MKLFVIHTAMWNLRYLVVYSIVFILTPYCLIAFYWLFTKRKMAVLYVINYVSPGGPASILWFPFYLYLVLVLFSGVTLYLKES